MNKNSLILLGTLVLIALIITVTVICRFDFAPDDASTATSPERVTQDETLPGASDRVGEPGTPTQPEGKIKADVFAGTLEEVNTGCFADGECYVVVGGKHVTALMGWSRDTVGSVVGVASFGDLESHIGERVEIYAQVNPDNTYTLYGSEGFYIKVLENGIAPKTTSKNECIVGGCSGQLCGEAGGDDLVSTCEYREEYACYQSARCERQTNGQCGWTETPSLSACLSLKQNQTLFEVQ